MKIIFNAAGIVSYTSRNNSHRISENLMYGKYKGYYYNIVDNHSHPTAYVGVNKSNKYYQVDYDTIHDMIDLSVHGGLTYSAHCPYYPWPHLNLWWLGWDYAHLGDHYAYDKPLPSDKTGKKWTLFEILSDTLEVIDQLCE